MNKIVVLGVGKNASEIINEMIERKTDGVEFAICENINAIDKILDHTNMIFIVFKALGKENTLGLAIEIAKAAKLAEILTIAVPISGEAEDEDVQKLKNVSDAIILSKKDVPRREYQNIEAIISVITKGNTNFDEIKNVFHNIGTVFVGVAYTEDYDSDSICDAFDKALDQTPKLYDLLANHRNYLINISADKKTSEQNLISAEEKIYNICNSYIATSDEQVLIYDHVFDERLDGVYRITLVVGMNNSGFRDYEEMINYEYWEGPYGEFMSHIERGLSKTEILKLGSYTKLLEAVLREGLPPDFVKLIISKGGEVKKLEKNGEFDEDILTDIIHNSNDVEDALEIINILFENKININKNLMKPFIQKPASNIAPILQSFINYGWDVNAHDEDGTTILMMAVFKMSFESIKILIEAGADVNAKNNDGWTPLTFLNKRSQNSLRKEEENEKIFNLLVENGAKL